MSLNEETMTSYDQYKDKVKALEDAGPNTNRVVFLFEEAEGNGRLNTALENVKKNNKPNATLIHVKITKAEFNKQDCPYRMDAKFKVNALPFIIVFNNKLTLGRNMIQKKQEGEKVYDEKLLGSMFK